MYDMYKYVVVLPISIHIIVVRSKVHMASSHNWPRSVVVSVCLREEIGGE